MDKTTSNQKTCVSGADTVISGIAMGKAATVAKWTATKSASATRFNTERRALILERK